MWIEEVWYMVVVVVEGGGRRKRKRRRRRWWAKSVGTSSLFVFSLYSYSCTPQNTPP